MKGLSQTFVAYEPRLLWHKALTFMPYEPILLGGGVVFNIVSRVPICFNAFFQHARSSNLGRAKGRGKTYRKAKPRKDGPSEAIFRDPPKAVSEEVS